MPESSASPDNSNLAPRQRGAEGAWAGRNPLSTTAGVNELAPIVEHIRELIRKFSGPVVITIDGPSASGKTSAAEALALELGLTFIDSGALFRCLAFCALEQGIPFTETERLVAMAKELPGRLEFKWIKNGGGVQKQHIFLDGKDVSAAIQSDAVSDVAPFAAGIQPVRLVFKEVQLEIAKNGCVTAGRAQGAEVFPDAQVKFFLDADLEERAVRRTSQNTGTPKDQVDRASEEYLAVFVKLDRRDQFDRKHKVGKLEEAPDAINIDSTFMTGRQTLVRIARDVARVLESKLPPLN